MDCESSLFVADHVIQEESLRFSIASIKGFKVEEQSDQMMLLNSFCVALKGLVSLIPGCSFRYQEIFEENETKEKGLERKEWMIEILLPLYHVTSLRPSEETSIATDQSTFRVDNKGKQNPHRGVKAAQISLVPEMLPDPMLDFSIESPYRLKSSNVQPGSPAELVQAVTDTMRSTWKSLKNGLLKKDPSRAVVPTLLSMDSDSDSHINN